MLVLREREKKKEKGKGCVCVWGGGGALSQAVGRLGGVLWVYETGLRERERKITRTKECVPLFPFISFCCAVSIMTALRCTCGMSHNPRGSDFKRWFIRGYAMPRWHGGRSSYTGITWLAALLLRCLFVRV